MQTRGGPMQVRERRRSGHVDRGLRRRCRRRARGARRPRPRDAPAAAATARRPRPGRPRRGARPASCGSTRRVSGVGPRAPLPLARSMYDVDVRLSEMDDVGVHRHAVSLPPFLFASTAEDETARHRRRRRRATTSSRPTSLTPPTGSSGSVGAARLAGRRRGGAPGAGRPGHGGHRDRQPGRRPRPRRPGQRRPVGAPVGARTFVFLHPSGVPDPHRQTDFWLPQLVGYPMETALAVARLVFGRVLERLPAEPVPRPRRWVPAVPAGAAGHGMGPQGRRPDHGGAARASSPTVSTTTPPCSPPCCCAGWSRTSASATSCSGPTTRSSSATGPRWRPSARSASTCRQRRILGGNAVELLGLPVQGA